MTLDGITFDSDAAAGLRPWSEAWYEQQKRTLGETACAQLGLYAIPDSTLLSVVIPVYNEKDTMAKVIQRIVDVPIRKELILVDDGSTDGTGEIIRDIVSASPANKYSEMKFVQHARNLGKGAAVKTGFRKACGNIVIIQDADLEYDPVEYPRLIKPIIEGKADVVYGSRFLGDQPHRVLYFWHYLGNRFLTTLSNCFTSLNLTDMETCYKVFKKEVVQAIAPILKQDRFGIEPEITARIARRQYRIYEIAISYSGRTYAEGKKIGWRDGITAMWCILRYGIAD